MSDINDRLKAMQEHFDSGITKPFESRKMNLRALKEAIKNMDAEIRAALFADLGKSAEEAYVTETGLVIAELSRAIKNLKEWMSVKDVPTDLLNFPSSSHIYQEPRGVVLIISPWNYPFQLLIIPLVGAIAAGNCVMLKPSEVAPATSVVIDKLIKKIYPPGYVSVMQGDGAEVVPAMMKDFTFGHVFYTGSTVVGKMIYKMAAEKLVPVTLELGGKSPCIVEADADIAVAAKRIVMAKFANTGQTCIAPDYILADEKVKDKLVKELSQTILKFYSKDASSNYDYGKLISTKRFDKLVSYLSEGRIVHGGKHDRSKLFLEPTLMDNLKDDSMLMQEEIFGPILPIIPYKTKGEALAIVKKHPTPLAFYLFTASKKNEDFWISQVSFGGGCINNAAWHFTNHNLPFGGIGMSGIGAYHGRHSFELFSHAKSVMKTPTWFDPFIKYPSLKGRLGIFKKLLG